MSTLPLLAALATSTAVNVPQCPLELAAAAVQVQAAPNWTGVVPGRLLVSGAGVVIGPPTVAPRAELRGDARQVSRYVTETAYAGLGSREKWLVCSYGQGGELEQAYRLPAAADRCVVRVMRNEHNDIEVAIACTAQPSRQPPPTHAPPHTPARR